MDKLVSLVKNTFTTIHVKEVTPNNHLFCDNKFLPDLTNVVCYDRAGNVYNAYTRLQGNLDTQFIDKITNNPIADVVKVDFYPFKEMILIQHLFEDTIDRLDSDLANSSNGIVSYGMFRRIYGQFFVRANILVYVKNSVQTPETHAKIVLNMEHYTFTCLRKIAPSQEIGQEYINSNLTLIESIIATQIM